MINAATGKVLLTVGSVAVIAVNAGATSLLPVTVTLTMVVPVRVSVKPSDTLITKEYLRDEFHILKIYFEQKGIMNDCFDLRITRLVRRARKTASRRRLCK